MTEKEYDKMLLVKVLYTRMNWSIRRISRLMNLAPSTVKSIYDKALVQLCEDNADNFPKSGHTIDLRYVGDTTDVEYIDGAINHNVCGGGRKRKTWTYEYDRSE